MTDINQDTETPTSPQRIELVNTEEELGRWPLFRDLLVFQGKLVLDAIRDIALSPISFIAVLVGIIRDPQNPGRHFYSLLQLGRHSDKWINLFGAASNGGHEAPPEDSPSVDVLVSQFEKLLVSQYQKGGVTHDAKEAIDKALDKVSDAVQEDFKPRNWR